jgi:putative salt-induced outer membrane protein YdiY
MPEHIRLSLMLAILCLAFSPRAHAQPAWLDDPSIPAVPPEGLLVPPPPLEPIAPPPVFEEPEPAVQPVWYYPWTWLPLDGWSNSAELGINGTDGNAESFAFQAGARFKRKTELRLFDLRLSHNRTTAGGVETQNNALLYADFERFLGDSPWTYFVKNGLEYDEFKAFDLRYNVNSGFGYHFFRTDDLSLVGRFGAGASREFGGPDEQWTPEALFGGDYEHQLSSRHKVLARLDYFPSWENFNDFRVVADVGWEQLIDEAGNFSLRLGANDRYDSTPNGRKANDINYQAVLLYKF